MIAACKRKRRHDERAVDVLNTCTHAVKCRHIGHAMTDETGLIALSESTVIGNHTVLYVKNNTTKVRISSVHIVQASHVLPRNGAVAERSKYAYFVPDNLFLNGFSAHFRVACRIHAGCAQRLNDNMGRGIFPT